MPKTKHRAGCISDSDDDVPLIGPNCLADKIKAKRKAECISDSDDDVPVFANKIKVAGYLQEELNAGAVDVRLGIAASLASTPSRNKVEVEVSSLFHDEEDVARIAAAKMTRFVGKDTIKNQDRCILPSVRERHPRPHHKGAAINARR